MRRPTSPLRLADTLDVDVYAGDDDARLLPLAVGQKIETVSQLRQLREAGFLVEFPDSAAAAEQTVLPQTLLKAVAGAPPEFQTSLERASRVRRKAAKALKGLMEQMSPDHNPEIAQLLPVSADLVMGVVEDPSAAAILAYLDPGDESAVLHGIDVAVLMVGMARFQDYTEEELQLAALCGLVHDVGKQFISDRIVRKANPVTTEEYRELKKHCQYGYDFLATGLDCPPEVARVAQQHHERLDGSGYPNQLRGSEIDRYSRLAMVADVFDAMTADQVYQGATPAWQVLAHLHVHAKNEFDRTAVEALTKIVGVFPVGTTVKFDSGEVGSVVAPNPEDSSRPVVRVHTDKQARPLPYSYIADLRKAPQRIVSAWA